MNDSSTAWCNMESLTYHPFTEWKLTAKGYNHLYGISPDHNIHKGKLLITSINAALLSDQNWIRNYTNGLPPNDVAGEMCIIWVILENGSSHSGCVVNSSDNTLIPTDRNKICVLETELKLQKKLLIECRSECSSVKDLCEELKALISSFKELESDYLK